MGWVIPHGYTQAFLNFGTPGSQGCQSSKRSLARTALEFHVLGQGTGTAPLKKYFKNDCSAYFSHDNINRIVIRPYGTLFHHVKPNIKDIRFQPSQLYSNACFELALRASEMQGIVFFQQFGDFARHVNNNYTHLVTAPLMDLIQICAISNVDSDIFYGMVLDSRCKSLLAWREALHAPCIFGAKRRKCTCC